MRQRSDCPEEPTINEICTIMIFLRIFCDFLRFYKILTDFIKKTENGGQRERSRKKRKAREKPTEIAKERKARKNLVGFNLTEISP